MLDVVTWGFFPVVPVRRVHLNYPAGPYVDPAIVFVAAREFEYVQADLIDHRQQQRAVPRHFLVGIDEMPHAHFMGRSAASSH
jgi:hypothetical protein